MVTTIATVMMTKIIQMTPTNLPLNYCLMFDDSIDQLERQYIESAEVTVIGAEVEPIAIL